MAAARAAPPAPPTPYHITYHARRVELVAAVPVPSGELLLRANALRSQRGREGGAGAVPLPVARVVSDTELELKVRPDDDRARAPPGVFDSAGLNKVRCITSPSGPPTHTPSSTPPKCYTWEICAYKLYSTTLRTL